MAYLYKHIRLDNNQTFYIGLSNDIKYKRAYSTYNRNKYWKNIVSKYGYKVEIIIEDIDFYQACRLERKLIKSLGRLINNDGNLVNIALGGKGIINMPKETKLKISEKLKGNKNSLGKIRVNKYPRSEKYIINLKNRMLNNKHPAKKVIDTNTKEIFSTVKEASYKNNIPLRTLIRWLKGQTKNKSNLIYYEYN